MSETLRGSVVGTMRPLDGDDVPANFGWHWPHSLSVQAVEVRRLDHVEQLLLRDEEGRIVAVLLVPLPKLDETAWLWA